MKKKKALEKIFKSLKILSGQELHIEYMIESLMKLDGAVPRTELPGFKIIGRAKTKTQLSTVESQARRLAKTLNSLNQPAITLLANNGRLNGYSFLPKNLIDFADFIARVDYENIELKPKTVNPGDELAKGISLIIGGYYKVLTGNEPTRIVDSKTDNKKPYGPYIEFLKQIFEILNIDGNTEHYAKFAIKEMTRRSRTE